MTLMRNWLWLSALVVALDQLTKYLVVQALRPLELVPLLPHLSLTLRFNTGAAFSFLNQAGGWQRWLFILLAVVVSVVILVWLWRLPRGRPWTAVALALVLGGAVGNLWDRVALGHVVDFVLLYYRQWEWPAFNVADSAIFVGAVILVLESLFGDRRSAPPG